MMITVVAFDFHHVLRLSQLAECFASFSEDERMPSSRGRTAQMTTWFFTNDARHHGAFLLTFTWREIAAICLNYALSSRLAAGR